MEPHTVAVEIADDIYVAGIAEIVTGSRSVYPHSPNSPPVSEFPQICRVASGVCASQMFCARLSGIYARSGCHIHRLQASVRVFALPSFSMASASENRELSAKTDRQGDVRWDLAGDARSVTPHPRHTAEPRQHAVTPGVSLGGTDEAEMRRLLMPLPKGNCPRG